MPRVSGATRPGRSLWFVAAAVIVLLPVAAAAGGQPRVEGDRLEFSLHDLDGNPVASSDPRFRGKVVFVDLWATWCPPCLSEIPTFADLQARYRDRGLLIVGIAFEHQEEAAERRAALRAFVEERGIDYLVLDGGSTDDFERALPAVKNVRGFPIEIFIDRRGLVVEARNGYGYKKRWARKLEQRLVELLDREPGH